MIWSASQDATLIRMWNEGFSCALISEAISGSTRSGVIGRAHRIIKMDNSPIEPRVMGRTYGKSKPSGRPQRKNPEAVRLNAMARQHRYRDRLKRENRAQFRASGCNIYSAAYRKHMPHMPEMTKGQLRAMLTEAVRNTV